MHTPTEVRPSLGRLTIGRASGQIGSGKYQVFGHLGRGGMADVQLAASRGPRGFNKLVVVKRLRPLLADDPSAVNMFLDEARLAARLNHPNLIHTYEFGEEHGGYFIVMEYLEGQPLDELLHALKLSVKRVSPNVWAKIIVEALAGLHHAHELCDYDGTPLNVVHRDVSPQNIVLTYDGGVKVVDFGIAKALLNITQTESQIIKGKIAYMAPEQASPQKGVPIDRRADVFSMGIVLWECLAQRRLITGDSTSAMSKLAEMKFDPPSRYGQDVPRELDEITLRALERDPARRFQTAQEMRDVIEKYLRTQGAFVTAEDIGSLVSGLFSEQHEDQKRQIREHMLGVGATPPPSSRRPNVIRPQPQTQDAPPLEPGAPVGHESPHGFSLTEPSRSLRSSRAKEPRHEESRAAWFVVLAGTMVTAAAVLAAVAAVRSGGAHGPAAASSPQAAPAHVHLMLRAEPADAELLLDGVKVQNPYTVALPVDAADHRVQATLPGYAAQARTVRFDGGDVMLDLMLERAPDGAAAPSASAPPRQGGRPGPAAPPRKQPKLDDDPWR
jgi:serine/threonine protein kinase